jgi:hypothetical protein
MNRLTTEQRARAVACGDAWTFVAIDPTTKLIPGWFVGDRSAESAYRFLRDLSPRLASEGRFFLRGPRGLLALSLAAAALASDFTLPSREPTLIS